MLSFKNSAKHDFVYYLTEMRSQNLLIFYVSNSMYTPAFGAAKNKIPG